MKSRLAAPMQFQLFPYRSDSILATGCPSLPPGPAQRALCWLRKGGFSAITFLCLWAALELRAEEVRDLYSPDNRIHLSIRMPRPGSEEQPQWAVQFNGRSILSHCSVGLRTKGGGELFNGVRVIRERHRSFNQRIPVLFGKSDHADDRFHEVRFTVQDKEAHNIDLIFRCYNDAVALRYELPEDGKARTVTIEEETTSFVCDGDPLAFTQILEHYKTSHEHTVVPTRYKDLPSNALFDLPLTFAWPSGDYVAITEAALRHYGGMALMRTSATSTPPRLECRITPRPDGAKVVTPLPMRTPWRVVLIGDRPGALLESDTVYCLNDPPAVRDLSWIRPGKITFSWWNGDVYDGKPGQPILSLEAAKRYIDFCARNGIPTHSVGWTEPPTTPWYYQSRSGVEPGPDTDVLRPRPDFDLAAIRRYAQAKNVKLWTWVHQAALRGKVEEAFAVFEKMGWSGMMVDFFDHDDQASVEFAESVIQAAARHHILIQLHGVWKPTGLQRTYPNLVNHEGALNLEYLKWSDRCTPEHNLMMAFTRQIAGPMDYHLGGFRASTRAEFKPVSVAPNVMGTRCHMLAMYVCFDNSNPMLADYPTAYEAQPGFDFLKEVPTWWDETKVIFGDVGELLVTARRKGKQWYLGGMAARHPRKLSIPLSFLGQGRYTAQVWKDAPDAETQPNHLQTESVSVVRSDTLKIHIATDGGFAAQISPATK